MHIIDVVALRGHAIPEAIPHQLAAFLLVAAQQPHKASHCSKLLSYAYLVGRAVNSQILHCPCCINLHTTLAAAQQFH
jgi:hypothetical protein